MAADYPKGLLDHRSPRMQAAGVAADYLRELMQRAADSLCKLLEWQLITKRSCHTEKLLERQLTA